MGFPNNEKERSGRTSVVTLALIVLLTASNIGVFYFHKSNYDFYYTLTPAFLMRLPALCMMLRFGKHLPPFCLSPVALLICGFPKRKYTTMLFQTLDYVHDIDMPYPSTYWYINFDGFDYITEFTITEYRNYV